MEVDDGRLPVFVVGSSLLPGRLILVIALSIEREDIQQLDASVAPCTDRRNGSRSIRLKLFECKKTSRAWEFFFTIGRP